MGFNDPRYNTRHFFCDMLAAVSDLTGSGTLKTFRVIHDKIQVLKFGFVAGAAFPNSGTMTTKPVLQLDKTTAADAVTTELTSVATSLLPLTRISPEYSQLINVAVEADLNSKQLELPVAGPAGVGYPTALKGDLLLVKITTSGVGGTQSARPYIIYREVEADA